MSAPTAFTVWSHPSFRPARMFRVYVEPEALYFIRMRGLISEGEGQVGPFEIQPGRVMAGALIGWLGRADHARELEKLGRQSPESMVQANRQNFRLAPDDVLTSSLSPPALLNLSATGHLARWTISARGRKRTTYFLVDVESLLTALQRLPALLGPSLSVGLAWDAARGRVVKSV